MSWAWHPSKSGAKLLGIKTKRYSWNDCADDAVNTAVGCSRDQCNTRGPCWARRFARRMKPVWESGDRPADKDSELLRGCQQCYDFVPHEHPERWEKFRAKPGQRIALNWMGDIFDPARNDKAIITDLMNAAGSVKRNGTTWLMQTRNMQRAVSHMKAAEDWIGTAGFQLGTSFCGPDDLDNVRMLAELPKEVVRFIAFEPWDVFINSPKPEPWSVFEERRKIIAQAKPNWAYMGPRTPRRKPLGRIEQDQFLQTANFLHSIGCEVIYKASCGAELYKRNEGVILP